MTFLSYLADYRLRKTGTRFRVYFVTSCKLSYEFTRLFLSEDICLFERIIDNKNYGSLNDDRVHIAVNTGKYNKPPCLLVRISKSAAIS